MPYDRRSGGRVIYLFLGMEAAVISSDGSREVQITEENGFLTQTLENLASIALVLRTESALDPRVQERKLLKESFQKVVVFRYLRVSSVFISKLFAMTNKDSCDTNFFLRFSFCFSTFKFDHGPPLLCYRCSDSVRCFVRNLRKVGHFEVVCSGESWRMGLGRIWLTGTIDEI